jgi:hypothetical protein
MVHGTCKKHHIGSSSIIQHKDTMYLQLFLMPPSKLKTQPLSERHGFIHTYLDSSMEHCNSSGSADKGISERHMLNFSSHQPRKQPQVVIEKTIKERNLRK